MNILRQVALQVTNSCPCRGTGHYIPECLYCQDSTYDHICNDEPRECVNARCTAARLYLTAIKEMNHASNSTSQEKLLEKLEKRLLGQTLDKQSIELTADEWNQILQWGRTANKPSDPLAIYTPSKTWLPSDVVVFETLDFIDSDDANEGTDKQYHFMFLHENELYDFYFDKGVYDNGFRYHSWWPYAMPEYATPDEPHEYWWDLSEQLIPNEFHETCENTYRYTGEQDAETYLKSKGYKFISLIDVDQEDEQVWESYLPKEWMQ